MSEPIFSSERHGATAGPGLLTPAACAIAALAVAVVSLSGQNLVLVGVQAVLGQGIRPVDGPASYYVSWGVGSLVPLLAAVLLARQTLRVRSAGWEAHLARAAVLVSGLAALGGVLIVVGGLLGRA